MKLFRSKKQVEELEAIPISKEIQVLATLKLVRVKLEYNINYTTPFNATIEYRENPEKWAEEGNQSSQVDIKATSWPELVDKVIEHFNKEEVVQYPYKRKLTC